MGHLALAATSRGDTTTDPTTMKALEKCILFLPLRMPRWIFGCVVRMCNEEGREANNHQMVYETYSEWIGGISDDLLDRV